MAEREESSEESALNEYEHVFAYLSIGEYPEHLTKEQKRNFRRKCKDNFNIVDGQLKYRKKGTQEWRIFIAKKDEKGKVLHSCHASSLGKNFCVSYVT